MTIIKVGVALVDVITGLHATVGILAALNSRASTGLGQRVEVNLLSSLLSGMVNQSSGYAAAGFVPSIMGNRHPSIAPYESYPTASSPIVIAVGNDRQFQTCMRVLGEPESASDPRFVTNPQRVQHRDELFALMSALLAGNTSEHWFAELSAAGVPCGPINDLAGAFALATELGLAPIASVDGVPTVANPIGLSSTPVSYRYRPPALGGDNDQVVANIVTDTFRRPPTAQEAVLTELRRAIVTGELRPGEQVRQDALAEQFGVSRVPLREALKILEGEGQVTYLPHRGYFVAELDVADLREVYRLRDLLETEAVRAAVPRLTDADVAEISDGGGRGRPRRRRRRSTGDGRRQSALPFSPDRSGADAPTGPAGAHPVGCHRRLSIFVLRLDRSSPHRARMSMRRFWQRCRTVMSNGPFGC